jgi:hypothetical protein
VNARGALCVLLAGLTIVTQCTVSSAEAPGFATCRKARDLYLCNGPAQVIVGGQHTREPTPSVVPVVAETGSIQLVACGAGTAAELAMLGDLQASMDESNCANWTKLCQQSGPGRNGTSTAAIRVVKQADGSWSLGGSVCQQPARPQVTAALVREQVTRLVPRAAIGLAPRQATLVNIQTIMWVGTAKQRTLAPLTILGRRVVVTLRFDHVDWAFGDGQSESSTTPGKAYDGVNAPCKTVDCPGYYGHTYGAMTVTGQATWVASFTVDGGVR